MVAAQLGQPRRKRTNNTQFTSSTPDLVDVLMPADDRLTSTKVGGNVAIHTDPDVRPVTYRQSVGGAMPTTLPTFSSDAAVEDVVEALKREGGVIILGLVTPEQLDQLDEQLAPYSGASGGDDELGGMLTTYLPGLLAKAPVTAALATHPLLMGVAKATLKTTSTTWTGDRRRVFETSVQLSDSSAITILPGMPAQELHRDDHTHHRTHPGPDSQVATFFAISPFTEENGCTRIIPGSHLWDDDRKPLPEETIGIEMPRGSVAMFLGSVYHGGGANKTDIPRRGMTLVYIQAHLRQLENQYLAVPREVVAQYPSEVQELLGWGLAEPYVGIYELQDPRVLLEGLAPVPS